MNPEKILRKDFIKGNFNGKHRGEIENHPIINFLRKNSNWAFLTTTIAKEMNISKYTVHGLLQKAVKKGIVIHKEPFFSISNKKKKKKR